MSKLNTLIVCMCLLLLAACKKEDAEKKTCSSTLHGYSTAFPFPSSISPLDVAPCTHGIINTTIVGISSAGGFTGRGYYNQHGVYNPDDGCYYVIGNTDTTYATAGAPGMALFKISSTGAVTSYGKVAGDSSWYYSLAYDEVHHRFLAIRANSIGFVLAELTLSGSTFTSAAILSAGAVINTYECAVDQNTGDIYYTGTNASTSSTTLYKLPWGGSAALVSTAPADHHFFSISYNTDDNQVYGIQLYDTVSAKLVRVDPSSGSNTELGADISELNIDFYSTTLDKCNNRFYIATGYGPARFIQLDLATGAVLQNDPVSAIYQGLEVQY